MTVTVPDDGLVVVSIVETGPDRISEMSRTTVAVNTEHLLAEISSGEHFPRTIPSTGEIVFCVRCSELGTE
jgi:hypothetical protein